MDDRSPCLIGWSTVSRHPGEPLAAWTDAAAAALGGASPDSIDVVYCQSWPYDDPAGRLASALGVDAKRLHYSGIGGTTPLVLLTDAAARISSGESEVCLVVGGEALDQVRLAKKAGERLAWSHRDPEKKPFPFEAPFHPAEIAHQVFQAYTTFALWDVARRARLGLGVDEHRSMLGELFAPFSAVAAANDDAWFPVARSAAELSEPTAENRMVAFPYTKRLMSVMDVDLTAAVVLASSAAADRLGVPADRRVHLRGASYRTDPVYVGEHDEPWRSPGMAAAFDAAFERAGVGIDDVAHLDLYSCFPSSVLFAMDALGLTVSEERPLTVTGGLPYFGGAGSCYVVASVAAMAARLVEDPGSYGLTTGVGMHMTKHAAAVWSTTPGPSASVVASPDPGPDVVRTIVDVHHGPATVAAYTVHHGRDGAATDGLAVCDVPGRAGRAYATVRDPDLLGALEAEEWVGRTVTLVDGGGGVNELRA